MRDVAEVFSDEPNRFLRCHPVEMIEAGEIHWARITAQRAFPAQIKIDIEIAHGQLAQAAVNRFAVTAAGEIRFRNCSPMSAHFENCDDVIGVAIGFKIEDQRWKPEDAQRRRGEDSALKARGRAIMPNFSGRSRRVTKIVGQVVDKPLNAGRRFQRPQLAQLGRRETKVSRTRCRSCIPAR